MPDFTKLLSTPTSEIHKPKPLPVGTYQGTIKSFKLEEQKTPKDTENPVKPVCNLVCGFVAPMNDVEQDELTEALQGADLSTKARNYTFWLTSDAQYRLVEFAASLGIPTEGRTLGEIIPELVNQPVYISVVHIDSTRNPGEKFDNIDKLASTVEAA